MNELAPCKVQATRLASMSSSRRGSGPRFLLLLLGLGMLVFALLQINDPDPLIWVTYYAAIACACTIAAYRPLHRAVFLALAAVTAAGVVLTFPGFIDWFMNRPTSDLWAPMSASRMYIEHSRELLGLLIAGAFLVTADRLSRRGR